LLPGYDPAVAIQSAMSLYWTYFFPTQDPIVIDETTLSERQKSLCALRAVVAVIPVVTSLFTAPQVTEAEATPVNTKFEERNKIFRACMPLWTSELERMEIAEGIVFTIIPNIPAFLAKIKSDLCTSVEFIAPRATEIIVIGGD